MPDPLLSAALREAYATVPVGQVVYDTVELWHSAFSEPIRVVADLVPLDARLEAGAPRNAGEVVTFTGYAFRLVQPELTAEAVPQARLEIDNTGIELMTEIDRAAATTEKITLIARRFLSDRLDIGPETDPPPEMVLNGISATWAAVGATAGFPDLVNRRFPRRRYDLRRFPGLTP